MLEQPLQLSVLFPPIPAKLVEKIRSGAFVDMKDLLRTRTRVVYE